MRNLNFCHIRWSIYLAFSLLLLLFIGCGAPPKQQLIDAGYTQLTTAKLDELFSKPVSMEWTLKNLEQGVIEMSPDGTSRIVHSGNVDPGHWKTNDRDELCMNWTTFRGGVEWCASFFRVNAKKYKVVEANNAPFTATIK